MIETQTRHVFILTIDLPTMQQAAVNPFAAFQLESYVADWRTGFGKVTPTPRADHSIYMRAEMVN